MNGDEQRERQTAITKLRADVAKEFEQFEARVMNELNGARATQQNQHAYLLQQIEERMTVYVAESAATAARFSAPIRRYFWGRLWWGITGK